MANDNIKYSIIRIVRKHGKIIRFYVRSPQGARVFGYPTFKMLTRRYRKAGLEFEVVYHMPKAKYPSDTHVSEHFTWAEFASKKCGAAGCKVVQVPSSLRGNAVRLAQGLEMMRAILGGGSMPLNSVYRTKAHNDHVGGALQSQHMQATAADVMVPRGQQARYVAAAKQVPAFKGIGIYPNGGVHVDVRAGARVFWDSWSRSK